MSIKLSIITATWNSAETLPATLESLQSQSCQEFESIVVDGGSSDNTVDVVKNTSVVDSWVSENDHGIYDALNKGILMAKGEYVGFLHSDDVFASKNSVEMLLRHIALQEPDAIYADLQYVRQDNVNAVVRNWRSGPFDVKKLRWGWMPPHPTFYMKKQLYQKYGVFDLKYEIAADYDSLLRYLYLARVVPSYLETNLVKMRVGGVSNQSLKNILKKSREDVLAMRTSGLPVTRALLGKNLRKIPQFFK